MSLFKWVRRLPCRAELSAGRLLAAEGWVRREFSPPHHPLKGGVRWGSRTTPATGDERRRWLHARPATVAEWREDWCEAFGKNQVRVTFAAEGGRCDRSPL